MITNSPRAIAIIRLLCQVASDMAIYIIVAGVLTVLDIIQIMERKNLIESNNGDVTELKNKVIIVTVYVHTYLRITN